jgi:hypothetical protein
MLAPPAPPARTSSAPLPAASADLAQRLAALKADAAAADAGFDAARPARKRPWPPPPTPRAAARHGRWPIWRWQRWKGAFGAG